MAYIRSGVAALVFTFGLFGADPEVESMKSQLQALMDRVAEQEKQLHELKTAQATLMGLLEKRAGSSPAQAVEPRVESAAKSAAPEEGKSWYTDRLKVGGYGSMRFEASDAPGGANGFTFRRVVFTTDAKITDRLRAYTELELERLWGIEVEKAATPTAGGLELKQEVEGNAGGELALEQAWGQYNFAEKHGVRAGIILPPLGRFNILHDDDYWDLPRRTLVDRDAPVLPVKSAWRELGAGVAGSFNVGQTGRLDYQAYVFNGATLDFNLESVAQTRFPRRSKLELEGEFGLFSGAFDGSQGARAVSWRAAYSPTLAGEFALSGYHGRYTPNYLGVSEPVNALGFDYKWRRGAFELEGEAIYSSFGRVRRVLDAFASTVYNSAVETTAAEAAGLESEIEFDLSNLARTRYGFWTDFKYHWRPAWLKRSFLGKPFEDPRLVPILRYEHAWLNRNVNTLAFAEGAITLLETEDLEQNRISLGFGFRPVRNFGIQAAYERNRRLNGSTLIFPRVDAGSTNGFLTGMVFSF
jgi:hypothetical protein